MSSVIEDTQPSGSASLSLLQRISYGSLDVAGNLLYCFGSTYILYFYTDVAGISLAVAGVILLLARIIGGIDAPIWGSSSIKHVHATVNVVPGFYGYRCLLRYSAHCHFGLLISV